MKQQPMAHLLGGLLVLVMAAAQVQAGTLTFIRSFVPPPFYAGAVGPHGIAFDPATNHLFLVNKEGPGSTILEITTDGDLVNTFTVNMDPVMGMHVLPNGNLLVVDARGSGQGFYECATSVINEGEAACGADINGLEILFLDDDPAYQEV